MDERHQRAANDQEDVSVVGLACARDVVVLFAFFDLTAVAPYFLIGFDRERREARDPDREREAP
jgi:NADH:ubiquinone oxidoreductase subunit 5 (subunit L)/multisubunit Na+/H+ antiporter MnhA subunit